MKLAEDSHRKFEVFFRELTGDEHFSLPAIEIYARRGANLLTGLFRINGITIGRRIVIQPELTVRGADQRLYAPKKLLAHEIAHVVQYARAGLVKFLWTYLKDYWLALKRKEKWDSEARTQAYLEIPFEVEARQIADDFIEWMETRSRQKDAASARH